VKILCVSPGHEGGAFMTHSIEWRISMELIRRIVLDDVKQEPVLTESKNRQIKKGTIRCLQCQKQMEYAVCRNCGCSKCFIIVYDPNTKKMLKFRKDDEGDALSYDKAQKKVKAIRAAVDNGKFKQDDWTDKEAKAKKIENMLDSWLMDKMDEIKADDFSSETLKDYKGYVSNYFIPYFKGMDVRAIDYTHIQKFKNSLQEYAVKVKHNGRKNKQISDKTRKNILDGLHAFFTWLWRGGIIKNIPAFPLISVKDKEEKAALEVEEQSTGLDKIPLEHRDVMELDFELGLRSGEVCVLKVMDIDTKKRLITICRTRSGAEICDRTKGKHKDVLPLSDRAFEIILRNIEGKFPNDFIFKNPNARNKDGIYTQKYLNNLWKKYSGLPVTYYEAARHSFCTQLVEDCGANILQAQILMRHRDSRQTQNYFHGKPQKLRDIVNRRGKNRKNIFKISADTEVIVRTQRMR
jgi:integrase